MTNHAEPNFRPDINGLRAWAVVAVVLYHFGVPGFSGGFVGVDVFFVISGFLMNGLVVKGLERGTFSVLGFYMARARRIVPALLVLCAVLLALGWFVLLPPDYQMLSTHSMYAMAFLSNVEFWQEAGYFDVASHEKWLLHTWSLSVEWQFYLFLPVLLWAVWRVRPGRAAQTWALGTGLLASLAASVWVTSTQPSMAFYWIHTRAWEMLAGGLVFLLGTYAAPADSVWSTSADHGRCKSALKGLQAPVVGLLLIMLAIGVFDKDSAWPGWRAILPVVAAMAVLAVNRESVWTGHPVAQWLGARSYSLYLWHWPVVVGLVYAGLQHNPLAIAGALVLTLLLGHVSYAWVEGPSRRWLSGYSGRRLGVAASGLVLAALALALPAVVVWKLQGISGRFAPAVELAAAESSNINPRRKQCHPNTGVTSPSCVYGGESRRVLALGDSHAGALVTALAAASKPAQTQGDSGVVQWSYSGCAFVPGLKPTPARQAAMGGKGWQCGGFIDWAQAQVAALPSNTPVVLINRYAQASFGGNEDGVFLGRPDVYFSKVADSATPEFLAEFAQHITQSACQLAKQRTVYMVRPIPEMGFDVPKTLSRRMAFGKTDDLFITLDSYQARNAWVWAAQDAARDQCGIKILDPTATLCRDGRCYGSQNGRPLYSDDDHLSEFGNKLLVPMFRQVFEGL